MIARLRRRHRRMTTALAVFLPLGTALALGSRPTPPVQGPLPIELVEPGAALEFAPTAGATQASAEQPFALVLGTAADGARAIRVDSRGAPAIPDALVYWSPAPSPDSALPDGAVLLGAVPEEGVRVLLLPADAARAPGRVLVWSVGWSRVVAELASP
jgi:hypothetical protein